MSLHSLLGDVPASEFLEQHFHTLPYSRPGGAAKFRHLGGWDAVETILHKPQADVMVVRKGRRYDGPAPTTLAEARSLHAEGCTLLVRHAERHHEGLAALAAGFHEDFAAPVNVHLYVTPGGSFGFDWHYDAEEVFILQTEGVKEYSLRKNTVNPWPTVETLPDDMHYEREIMPLTRCTLSAGDWLYIPAGYWHRADAAGDSISLAVGVLSPTAIDVYDFLRQEILSSLRWRTRLPVSGRASPLTPEELAQEYRGLLADLAADFSRLIQDPHLLETYLSGRIQNPKSQIQNP